MIIFEYVFCSVDTQTQALFRSMKFFGVSFQDILKVLNID
jgi:hypothetical protein